MEHRDPILVLLQLRGLSACRVETRLDAPCARMALNGQPLTKLGPVHTAHRRGGAAADPGLAEEPHPDPCANIAALAGLRGLSPARLQLQQERRRLPVRRARRLDSLARRPLRHRHRRHQPAAGHADHGDRLHRDPLLLARHRRPRQGILRHVPVAADGNDRRLHLARLLPVLRVLGSGAGADVLHHRRLGRAAEALRRHQVLPLHAGRRRADAARHPDALLPALPAVRLLHLRDLAS